MGIKIGVYGAGIIGLTTALSVQKSFRDAEVTILASDFGQATTSDGAAGLYRPGPSFSVGSDELTTKVLRESFDFYTGLLERESSLETGVSEISGYKFSNISEECTRTPLIEGIVPIYRKALEEEMDKWKYGSFFSSVITEGRRFLPWCEKRFEENNGVIVKTKVRQLSDMFKKDFDVVFNCLGLGAKSVFGDRNLVPLRGQVLKVQASWLKHFYYGDHDTYVIPGIDNVTLGGTRNYDNADLSASGHDTASIWERCTQLLPRLSTCEIQRIWVGLRPHRQPVRIEAEAFEFDGKKVKVIHNYGHGGYGVTTAPGSANRAINVFVDSQRATSKL